MTRANIVLDGWAVDTAINQVNGTITWKVTVRRPAVSAVAEEAVEAVKAVEALEALEAVELATVLIKSDSVMCVYTVLKQLVRQLLFKWLWKVIARLQLLCLVIGLKISRQLSQPMRSKTIAPCNSKRDFSRALSKLQVIAPVVIGRSNKLAFQFFDSHLRTTLLFLNKWAFARKIYISQLIFNK